MDDRSLLAVAGSKCLVEKLKVYEWDPLIRGAEYGLCDAGVNRPAKVSSARFLSTTTDLRWAVASIRGGERLISDAVLSQGEEFSLFRCFTAEQEVLFRSGTVLYVGGQSSESLTGSDSHQNDRILNRGPNRSARAIGVPME